MRSSTYEVKNIDEAIKKASEEFGVSSSELVATIISEKKGFLGRGKSYEVEVKVTIDGVTKGKEYLQTIVDSFNANGYIEKIVKEDTVEYNVNVEEMNGMLIGKNSKHLIAIQTLLNIVVNKYYNEDEQKTVILDIGGYRKRRVANLERMAVEFGKQLSKTKQEIKLDNLNAYERKVIHTKLATWDDIETHSEGEEPNRYLIISPKAKK